MDPKKGHWLLTNLDPLQNLKDSDVTRCGSGSDTGVEHGLEKKNMIKIVFLRKIAPKN
jgi:hypothetical protein